MTFDTQTIVLLVVIGLAGRDAQRLRRHRWWHRHGARTGVAA